VQPLDDAEGSGWGGGWGASANMFYKSVKIEPQVESPGGRISAPPLGRRHSL
jgi:hypothetical protein